MVSRDAEFPHEKVDLLLAADGAKDLLSIRQ